MKKVVHVFPRLLKQTGRVLPFLILVALLNSGCTFSGLVANRIVEAPNLRQDHAWWNDNPSNKLARHWNGISRSVSIPVGPPSATLLAAILEPGDYGTETDSNLSAREGHYEFHCNVRWAETPVISPHPPRGTVVLLHGYSALKEQMIPWAGLLAQQGYRCVLLDLRGHGDSSGERIYFGHVERHDLRQALDWLSAEDILHGPVAVLGYSYGGVLAIQWAATDSRLRTAVAIAPYDRPERTVLRLAGQALPWIPERTMERALRKVAARHDAPWNELATAEWSARCDRPLLLIGALNDEICPLSDLNVIAENTAPGSRNLAFLGDHMTIGLSFHWLTEPITEWFDRQLTTPEGFSPTSESIQQGQPIGARVSESVLAP